MDAFDVIIVGTGAGGGTLARHLAPSVEVIPEPAAALERALELAAPDDVVFATGSLYLVGDLRRHWDERAAGAFPDAALPSARNR